MLMVVIPKRAAVEYHSVVIPREMPLGVRAVTEKYVTEVIIDGQRYQFMDDSWTIAWDVQTGEIVRVLEECW